MPCCGLHEYRVKVPIRYTLAGGVVFWGGLILMMVLGVLTCWSGPGRQMLKAGGAFLGALWRETMRSPGSVPARWACRLSGRVLKVSPALAELVFRHPELPVLAGLALLAGAFAGGIWICSFWV